MDLENYQKQAKRTFLSKHSKELDILHCLIGIQTEVGELVDAYKKNIYYGKELDKTNVSEEFGDIHWYLANLAELEGIDVGRSLQNNINKLKIRFPEKFSEQNAIVRNLDAERVELEK